MFDVNAINNNQNNNNNNLILNPSDDDGINNIHNDQLEKPSIGNEANKEKSAEISGLSDEHKDEEKVKDFNKDHLNLVLIGHVDHGKSTIAGQILLQTGQIDERTISKYKKMAKERAGESWWIAYLMDDDEEERKRGKTIECGKAYFNTLNKRYTILDAPGHRGYVPNMIIGATQADVALLVISAARDEFEKGFERDGQTKEHGLIAMSLGIKRIIVVINKMDIINYDQKRYQFIKTKVHKYLTKEMRFSEKNISFVPISGQQAINIKEKNFPSPHGDWYKNGATLLDILDGIKTPKRGYKKALRIPIIDKLDKGLQIIAMVQQGIINKGDSIKIMPQNIITKVYALEIDDGAVTDNGNNKGRNSKNNQHEVKTVKAGENVMIRFDKSDKILLSKLKSISSGSVICGINHNETVPVVEQFVADIYVNEIPDGLILTKGYKSMFHCHNLCVLCEIIAIKRTKTMKHPVLRQKDNATVRIRLSQKCVLETYNDCRVLGRFILRDQNKTVIIGKISKVFPLKLELKGRGGNKNKKKVNNNDEEKSHEN